MESCSFCQILSVHIPSVVSNTKFSCSPSFANIFYVTVVFSAFYQVNTVSNFKVKALVDFPLILVNSEVLNFSYICASRAIFATFLHASFIRCLIPYFLGQGGWVGLVGF